MGSICIINGYVNAVSETFIHAHIEYLEGNKVVLNNYYPEYIFNGRTMRYFHTKHPFRKKLKKLLPQFLYHRLVTRHELSESSIHDAIEGFFQNHNVDVVLAEYGPNGADICKHLRKLNIPLIVHFHGHDAHREPDIAPYKEKYRQMFDYAFRVVSVSNFMTDKLVKMGANPSRIVYNPYGARDYFYEIQSEYRNVILAVGRFTDIKAPYLTLLAFKQLLEHCPDVLLIMVGDGPLRESCMSLAKTWGIEGKVQFPGAQRHEQILPLYKQACCFVQHSVTTSYGDAEGTPVAIIEAGAAGLPVVATRHAGIADAVVHGETGFLVEERDVTAMANYLRKLVEDKELCKTMGKKARTHIRTHFNLKNHISCLQNLVNAARAERKS